MTEPTPTRTESGRRAPPAFLRRTGTRPPAPSRPARVLAVARRHLEVYATTLLANSLPPFIEPVLFLTAIGLGLGGYLNQGVGGLPLAAWMGPGALAMTAMFTAGFETTYGTFVRLVFQRTYDALLATPVSLADAFLGELLFCGLKGFVFSACVLSVYVSFGAAQGWWTELRWTAALAPCVGFVTGWLFGAIGLRVTASVDNLNNFNFFISGVMSPLALFSGMVFPVEQLPRGLREVAMALPLYHVTELQRLLMFGPERAASHVGLSALYLLALTALLTVVAIRALERRIMS